jgi:hypothetical protein
LDTRRSRGTCRRLMGRGPRAQRRSARGAQNAIAFSTSPAVNRPPSGKPHSRAMCFSFTGSTHHSALYQSASSTPIGDRNRSGLFGLRLTSQDGHCAHRGAVKQRYEPEARGRGGLGQITAGALIGRHRLATIMSIGVVALRPVRAVRLSRPKGLIAPAG